MSERLRVLYLTPDYQGTPGGIARHARLACSSLAQAGTEVTVIALHDREESFADVANLRRSSAGASRARFVLEASKRSAGTDLVICGHPHFAPLGVALARARRVPLIVFAHGIEAWRRLSLPRRLSLRATDVVICVSHTTRDRLCSSNNLDPERVQVLHSAVAPIIGDGNVLPRAEDPPRILTVARLSGGEGYKGHEHVLRALPELLPRFPGLVYDIVGDGDHRETLQLLADRLGIRDAVRFHGWVSEAELGRHYDACRAFVMPSRSEGFGFVFLEAMAHSRPVIAGDEDAAREVVRDGDTGFLVRAGDTASLVQAIARVLDDRELAARMGRRGREVATTDLSIDRFRAGLLCCIGDVLGGQVVSPRSHRTVRGA